MEIMMPSPPRDFDFNSARSTPFVLSAPSTPKRFGEYYFSAPTSPSRMAEIYCEVNEFDVRGSGGSGYSASIPFGWEEKPGTPKSSNARKEAEADDFAFEFNEGSEGASLSAEELFDGGKIKPLKPPPRLQIPGRSSSSINNNSQSLVVSPKSPRYLAWQETISNNTSGSTSERKKENGPYKEATREAGMRTERERGRDRVPRTASGRVARSLSPYRVSTYPWEDEEKQLEQGTSTKQSSLRKPILNSPNQTASSSKAAGSGSGSGSKKWRLKDFLLFRSASEGRATDTDPFRKYAAVFRKQEDIKNSSSRAADGSGSISRRRSGPISAHELHYTVNKAVSEDLKKKTFLPYKQGILGRLAFNPAVHALANGFGSLYR